MKQGAERRRFKRRPILETFSLFCVVLKKGSHRLPVHDVSDAGIGFDLDIDGENLSEFPLKSGERLDVQLYLNQTLYLPIALQVARIEDTASVRRIGAELINPDSPSSKAFIAFLNMLDLLAEAGEIQGA
jgi:hypothetical protein